VTLPVAEPAATPPTPTRNVPSAPWPASCRAIGGAERAGRLARWIQTVPDDVADTLPTPPWMSVVDPRRYLEALRRDAAAGPSGPRAAGLLRELDAASRSPGGGWAAFNEGEVAALIDRAREHGELEDIGAFVRQLVESDDIGADETRRLVQRWKGRWAELIRQAGPSSVSRDRSEHAPVAQDVLEQDDLDVEPRHVA
jgi:hypothetical protein